MASPDDFLTCLHHFSLRLFVEVRRSSYSSEISVLLCRNIEAVIQTGDINALLRRIPCRPVSVQLAVLILMIVLIIVVNNSNDTDDNNNNDDDNDNSSNNNIEMAFHRSM